MPGLKFLPLVLKYLVRHRGRSLLSLGGVATAMFLFCSVQAMQQGVREATVRNANDTKLVVYRQDRYCPFTSNLPQNYEARIAKIPGVKSVVPVKVAVSNCRTGLDVVTFRGIPSDSFDLGSFSHAQITDGSVESWKRRSDAALLGERVAARRGLKVGDRAEIGGITIYVAGIMRSPEPQDQNVGYTHLDFIQRAGDNRAGIVTQFNVTVTDPGQLEATAKAIDDEFRTAQEPTTTWSEKNFVARATSDILEIITFARWLGWGCVVGVFALVFNAIVLSVQDRIKDHAIMQTLGYTNGLVARLIIAESMMISLAGGFLGVLAGVGVMSWGSFSLSVEGLSINIHAGWATVLFGLFLSAVTGILAGLVPAWQASRREIAACFRAV
ncbi:MAG: ABC transporter permease [Desulfomonile tiedjei]|uniref:ABC transporter permease n=1 Tax=Desulfomonile tiedjei TaxID=2358 RepID=A0A9D6Z8M6_9BACT|nr:ABC transporter permease [Desulfomonile tiedjei]